MTLLWAVLVLMTLAGALIVILPVLRYRRKPIVSGELVNAMVFKDRLQELDQDLRDGKLAEPEYTQLKNELEKTLLDDVGVSQSDNEEGNQQGRWLVWPLLVLVPLFAFAVYYWEGDQAEVKSWFVLQEKMAPVMPLLLEGQFDAAEKAGIGVDDFIRTLQKQLQSQPDDAKGWYLLGVSYIQIKLPKPSELAFRRATELEPDNTDYRLGHIQASMMASGGELTPQIEASLTRILQQQPDNPKPYMTLGMAYYQNGDPKSAVAIWQRYLDRKNVDERAAQLLTRSIEVARNELKNNASQSKASKQTEDAMASSEKATTAAPTLRVTVDVSDEVKKNLKPTDTLFIYAKAEMGPPMPLAVSKQAVSSWPMTVILSDENAMTPAMTLSKFPRVVVQARVSASGNATPQSGDWEAVSHKLELTDAEQAIEMRIDRRVP